MFAAHNPVVPMLPQPLPTDQSFAQYRHLLLREAEALGHELAALCEGMSAKRFNWKPAPDSWSVGQCVHHLVVFNRQYYTSIDKSIDKARRKLVEGAAQPAQGMYRSGILGGFLARMMYPAKLKVRAPQAFQPSESAVPLSALRDFSSVQRHLVHLLRSAGELNLNRIRVASPAAGLLRFRLGDILTILLLHERRHLEQMQRIIAHDRFPSA